jgi:hypothetical protein
MTLIQYITVPSQRSNIRDVRVCVSILYSSNNQKRAAICVSLVQHWEYCLMYSRSNNHLKAGDTLISVPLRCFCVTLGQVSADADENALKLQSFKCLAELPICRSDVIGSDGPSIAGSDLEGESLPIQIGVALPILAPVAGHCLPTSVGTFDGNRLDIACTSYVGNEHQIEVRVAIDRESNSSFPQAWYSAHTYIIPAA